jgi:hypothetical protein
MLRQICRVRAAILLAAMSFAAATPSRAADVTIESPRTRTHLLELFTSEGCSSCPPAEAWFSRLKDEKGLWRDFVPVAFHVSYWDHLGWRDPFASKLWTARQHAYADRWKSSSVYTPGFVLNGRESRERAIPGAAAGDAGVLALKVSGSEVVHGTFASTSPAKGPLELHVARLGFELSTDVKAGENRGRKLLHDFVVISLTTVPLNDGAAELRLPPANASVPAASRQAVAAWVTERGDVEPLQAAGGWLR